MLSSCLFVGVGGFLGAVSRMLLAKFLNFSMSPFWSICLINCIGCFGFGLISGLPGLFSDKMKELLLVGFMGSFTTYSSYAFYNYKTLSSGSFDFVFLLEILVQTLAGLSLLYLGLKTANYF